MNITKHIPTSVTNKLGRAGLKISKKSPTLLFVGGLVGVVSGSVLACRATVKASHALDDFKTDVEKVKAEKGNPESEQDYRKDLTYVYAKNTFVLVKLYAPAVIVGGIGIACLTGSHVQLTRRNNALMAAYAALQTAYENYRERVRDEVGKEKELDLYHGAQMQTRLGADGKELEIKAVDPNKWSPYARFFNETSDHFQDDGELNRIWVQCQQEYLNQLLRARGHVFLNEAYDALGLTRTSAGQVVGWVMNGDGDNFIDFGLFSAYHAKHFDAREPTILLDFNVDGVVVDKL
jgi:Family of unknown function (DUF6353)